MTSFIVKCLLYLLKSDKLSVNDRLKLSTHILDKLSAKPLSDIIYVNSEGQLVVNGNIADHETVALVRESAKAALNNRAMRLIRDQVLYTAYTVAANKADSDKDLLFGRAAIWWGQQEYDKLMLLSNFGE